MPVVFQNFQSFGQRAGKCQNLKRYFGTARKDAAAYGTRTRDLQIPTLTLYHCAKRPVEEHRERRPKCLGSACKVWILIFPRPDIPFNTRHEPRVVLCTENTNSHLLVHQV